MMAPNREKRVLSLSDAPLTADGLPRCTARTTRNVRCAQPGVLWAEGRGVLCVQHYTEASSPAARAALKRLGDSLQ